MRHAGGGENCCPQYLHLLLRLLCQGLLRQALPPDPPTPLLASACPQRDIDEWRSFVGRYGISGRMQTMKIGHLSEGQKSRIVFAMLCMKNHNLLLLDGAAGGRGAPACCWQCLTGGGCAVGRISPLVPARPGPLWAAACAQLPCSQGAHQCPYPLPRPCLSCVVQSRPTIWTLRRSTRWQRPSTSE